MFKLIIVFGWLGAVSASVDSDAEKTTVQEDLPDLGACAFYGTAIGAELALTIADIDESISWLEKIAKFDLRKKDAVNTLQTWIGENAHSFKTGLATIARSAEKLEEDEIIHYVYFTESIIDRIASDVLNNEAVDKVLTDVDTLLSENELYQNRAKFFGLMTQVKDALRLRVRKIAEIIQSNNIDMVPLKNAVDKLEAIVERAHLMDRTEALSAKSEIDKIVVNFPQFGNCDSVTETISTLKKTYHTSESRITRMQRGAGKKFNRFLGTLVGSNRN
jgi:hypothetical protein